MFIEQDEDCVLVTCACGRLQEHSLLVYDFDDGDISVSLTLNTRLGFWERVKVGLRYIFLRKVHSSYQETVVSKEDKEQLIKWLERR